MDRDFGRAPLKTPSKLPRLTGRAAVPLAITAVMFATGCTHDRYGIDHRFPAPRVVPAKHERAQPTVRKSSRRIGPVAAKPVAVVDKPAPLRVPEPRLAEIPQRPAAPPPNRQSDTLASPATDMANAPTSLPVAASPAAKPAKQAATEAVPAAEARPSTVVRRAAPETPASIGSAIEQAELYLRIGHIAGARGVLESFVKAKHPEALAELGKTYDPIELAKFLVAPGVADAQRAIELYTEAARLGSQVAKLRLERLQAAPAPVDRQR